MTAIEFENVGKQYRLGLVSSQTLKEDVQRWWAMNILGKEDPCLKIGETNERSVKGASDYVWALRDISFKVEQGDVVGIIGRNGAGKSTLLKILSRVTSPSTGSIRARGRIGSLLEVGTGFHPEMTGRENIFMNGAILGMTKAEVASKFDEIVDFSGCERYIDTPVKRYSSGMMVRLGFAVAAHLDPEILVVDEVLAVGDAEFQKKAIGKMKDVSTGEGRTVLFVSHNMDSILNLCNTGILLSNGSVAKMGKIKNVVENYLSDNNKNIEYFSCKEKTRVYVSEVKFIGNEQQVNGIFRFEDEIKIGIIVIRPETYKISKNCNLSVSLYNRRNIRICTKDISLFDVNGNRGANIELIFPSSIFAPGNMYITISIHEPKKEVIERLTEVCDFTIVDTGTEFLEYNGADRGVIYINPDISYKLI